MYHNSGMEPIPEWLSSERPALLAARVVGTSNVQGDALPWQTSTITLFHNRYMDPASNVIHKV